ncbi:sugar phosphate nucleotidyltransferase [Paenibacillus sp. MBLB4367]|uniref:sugar phosphate nucleotidyltransferase n=1 Tax=Paenibacillus sp. MBLB4367 TaxID=3384767 RepID=UPI0039083D5A
MKAVIMAGGKGTRLRPLTCNTPKPMVPLLDRPVMEYTIELLKKHGITDIAVTMQFLPEVIRNHFGDGSEFGVRLRYFEEESPLGTAGSVKNAESFLDETFIVISGDALTDFDLTAAITYHRNRKALATLVLTHVESPLEYGVVMTDDTGKVVRFLEKPSWGEVFSDAVNTGIYIVEKEAFELYTAGVEYDFSKDLFPLLMEKGLPLYAYHAKGYWSDIGNLTQYRQTQIDMLDGKVDVRIAGTEVLPRVWVGEHADIAANIRFAAPAFIGRGAVLEDYADIGEYSVIGGGCLVRQQARVERAVLWSNASVGRRAEIYGATLCRNAAVENDAFVAEGAVIGDASRVGGKSVVGQDVMVWPNKTIEPYAQVKESIVWTRTQNKALFGQWGVKGTWGADMTTTFAARLALAYGSLLKAGCRVGISHDATPTAALVAGAFASGLHASGVHTEGYGTVTSSVARFACWHAGNSAGVHVRQCPLPEEDAFVIEFYDDRGLPVSKAVERKIENAFAQEDSRRMRQNQLGAGREAAGIAARYCEQLLSRVDSAAICGGGYSIVLAYEYRNMRGIIPELLEALGCGVIHLNGHGVSREEVAQMVKLSRSDLGVLLDADGQHLTIVTEEGQIVDESVLSVLQIVLQLQRQEGVLYVPVHVPGIVEGIGARYDRKVIRTKADRRSVMEGCQTDGFHPAFDGLYVLVHLLERLALQSCDMSELVDAIPSFAMMRRSVDCPWQDKGKVMRCLMEETEGKRVELIDGIKVFHDGGWTLILPDSDEPVVQVYAHAASRQKAEELAYLYTRKIEDYRRRQSVS